MCKYIQDLKGIEVDKTSLDCTVSSKQTDAGHSKLVTTRGFITRARLKAYWELLRNTKKNSKHRTCRCNALYFYLVHYSAYKYVYLKNKPAGTEAIFGISTLIYINQLDALNFITNLFHASTRFQHKCSSSGGQNCTIQSLVSSHL